MRGKTEKEKDTTRKGWQQVLEKKKKILLKQRSDQSSEKGTTSYQRKYNEKGLSSNEGVWKNG